MEDLCGGLGIESLEEIAPLVHLSPGFLPKREVIEAYYDDAGLWCVLHRQGEDVWIEKHRVIYVYKAADDKAV